MKNTNRTPLKYGRCKDGKTWAIFKNKYMPGYSIIYGTTIFNVLDQIENTAPERISKEMYASFEHAFYKAHEK